MNRCTYLNKTNVAHVQGDDYYVYFDTNNRLD